MLVGLSRSLASDSVRFRLWIAVIVLIVVPWTMFVGHTQGHRVGWVPFFSPPIRLRDVVANILLYVPFGYLNVRRSAAAGVVASILSGLALSLLTEATQIFSHGRFPSATDVVCNTLGAAVGAAVALTWKAKA